jgi:pimeloyl-ACP methyl ester carboxylesterase
MGEKPGRPSSQSARNLRFFQLVVTLLVTLGWACSGCEDTASDGESQGGGHGGSAQVQGWTTPDEAIDCVPITPHCLGPMPSNLFTRHDPSTRTGLRIHLTEENLSQGVFAYAAQYMTPGLLNRGDGFSPAGMIVIPLQGPVAEEDLPADLESSVQPNCPILLVDATSGERIPYHIWLDPGGLKQSPPQYFLVMTPAQLLRPATAHLVILRAGLRQPDGTPVVPYPAFEQIKSSQPLADPLLESLRNLYANLFSFLENPMGIGREALLLAFDFTTRSEDSLLSPMQHLRTLVEQQTIENPPTAILQNPRPGILEPGEACEVSGSYRAPSFRDPETKVLTFDTQGLPSIHGTDTVPFVLKLPKVPAGTKAPVVVFGHGLWLSKETVILVSGKLLQAGFAVIAVDAACHGGRSLEDGFIGDLFQLETLERALSCLSQTVGDELTLVELLKGDLSDLDLLPYKPGQGSGDGVPDLDTEHIYYVGQSMGTVIGLTFVALSRDIEAAVLNVPGAGIVNIVTNGEITYPMVGSGFIPAGTPPLDAHLSFSMIQMYVDYVDPIHFAPQVCRAPLDGNAKIKRVLIQGALNDGLIPNWCTDMLARELGVPVIEPYAYLPYGLSAVPSPAKGSGFYQYAFTDNPLVSHGVLIFVPECRSQLVDYLKTAYLEGTPKIRDPFAGSLNSQ